MSRLNCSDQFRECNGFPGYVVGRDGSLWSCRDSRHRHAWKKLKPTAMQNGYVICTMQPKDKKVLLSRLVATAFHGECPPNMECCHNDGNPSNNSADNLRWDTRSANQMDRADHGTSNQGSSHGMSKLTENDVRQIRADYAAGGVTYLQLATRYNVKQMCICRIVKRKGWLHIE